MLVIRERHEDGRGCFLTPQKRWEIEEDKVKRREKKREEEVTDADPCRVIEE
jgi:hypothetical protein